MNSPLQVAIIGMGGFAGVHHHALVKLEALGESRLIATCDPFPDHFADKQVEWRFRERGVQVFEDYRDMLGALGAQLDLLVIPTPIPLHSAMHRAGVERGIPVYLEKPPTLDPDELETMIACDRQAKKATFVGFNFIIEKARQSLKARLLAGEFGALRETRLHMRWPRPTSYFTRNNWAGRLVGPDGRLILDSCMGNAMAHYVHNLLYWAGIDGQMDWAQPEQIRAELYRAHKIEGADTFFAQAKTRHGITLRFALTHACAPDALHQVEELICEKAIIRYVTDSHYEILRNDGSREREKLAGFNTLVENHSAYYRYLRGETERPATTLADSRPFVHLNNLVYLSTGEITSFPGTAIHTVQGAVEGQQFLRVDGLESALNQFFEHGTWPDGAIFERQAAPRIVSSGELPQSREAIHQLVRS